jgi:hypothetical protein
MVGGYGALKSGAMKILPLSCPAMRVWRFLGLGAIAAMATSFSQMMIFLPCRTFPVSIAFGLGSYRRTDRNQ